MPQIMYAELLFQLMGDIWADKENMLINWRLVMEKWDLLDQNRKPLGRTHLRGEPMSAGTYHNVVEVWTVNSCKEILLTLRHPDKEYGNYWENTGGSVLAGERSSQGAVRELFEETGIEAEQNDLLLLGCRREEEAFVDTYIVRKDVDLTELVMQDGETIDAQWVTLVKLDELIFSERIAKPNVDRLQPIRKKFEDFLNHV